MTLSDVRLPQPIHQQDKSCNSSRFQDLPTTDLLSYCHQALQTAVQTDEDQCIGRALDALGVAYGVIHDHERTLQYCAIAASILEAVGDGEGAAIAIQHTHTAASRLEQL